jgi:hypothetical protein
VTGEADRAVCSARVSFGDDLLTLSAPAVSC